MDETGSIDQTMSDTLAKIEGGDSSSADRGTDGGPAVSDQGASARSQATQQPVGSEPTSEAWRSMPKSWRRELGQTWGAMSPEAMRYVHEREAQVDKGIAQYRGVVDKWNQTLTPYNQYIRQYNLDPHAVVNNLLPAHIILKHGTPEQRMAVMQILDRDYGLSQFFNGQQGQGLQRPAGPDMTPFANRIAQLEAAGQQRALADASNEVETFLADRNNEFAADAAPRMLQLLESGRASTLREAYDVATRTDPAIFERIIQRRVTEAARPQRPIPSNVRPSASRAPSNPATRGTIEDTMRETLHSMNNR